MSLVSASAPPGGGSGSSFTWLWILIGAVVLISVIVLALVRRRAGRYVGSGSVVMGGWLSGAIDVCEKGSALRREISAALRPGEPAPEDSGADWPGIQRRSGDLARELEQLRATAPESEDRARAADALGTLQSLRSAMDGQNAPGGATAGQARIIRASVDALEASLHRLRSRQPHLW
jgi:hypothetical protein